jgi:CHAT domain-containing protein/tetratricopeptide (TPR) repeat protein
MRAAIGGVVLVALVGFCSCGRPPRVDTPVDLRNAAVAAMRSGDLGKAAMLADSGLAQEPVPDSPIAVELRLLKVEALLFQGKLQDAAPLLDAPVSDGAPFAALRARRRLLEASRALIVQSRAGQRPTAAMEMAGEAARLAAEVGAEAVRLDAETLAGRILAGLGRRDEAQKMLEAARDRAAASGDHYHEAGALLNLGMMRFGRSRFDEALPYFDRILSFDDIQEFSVYAAALANAGICQARLGEFDRAIDLQRRAVAAHERRALPPLIEQSLGELGNTYILQGEPRAALPFLRRAYDIASASGLTSDAAVWARNVAEAAAEMGDWDTAERFNEHSLALKRQQGSGKLVYNTLNRAKIAAGRRQPEAARAAYREALDAAGADPGVIWEAHAGLAGVLLSTGRPRDAVAHFEEALRVIESTRSDLLQTDMKLSFLSRLIRFYRQYVDALILLGDQRRALTVADASRARVMADRMGVAAGQRATVADFMRAARRLDSTLVAYWMGTTRAHAWVVTASDVRMVELPAADRLASLTSQYRDMVAVALANPLASEPSVGDALSVAVIQPLAASLPRTGRVVIVPDGPLHQVNFEMLPVGSPRHYWIEDVTLAVAPSLTLLASGRAPGPVKSGAVLLVGDPTSSDTKTPSLRFARQEIDSIAGTFPPADVTEIRGKDASPAAYSASRPERFRVIHFAAHGTVNLQSPLESAIELSPAAGGQKLYLRDVAERPLSADLVTVSACRSASARTYSGEGLVGFAWAFLRAGVGQVVAGLWDVDDQSTAALMAGFYRELAAGASPAAALRHAKLAMLRAGGNFAKPYYWAPFQLFIAR